MGRQEKGDKRGERRVTRGGREGKREERGGGENGGQCMEGNYQAPPPAH